MRQDRFASCFRARPARRVVAAIAVAAFWHCIPGQGEKPVAAAAIAESIATHLDPLGRLIVSQAAAADLPSGGGKAPLSGQAVYEGLCFGCHRDGLAGAPKFGDTKAWAPRIAQGFTTLAKHAIEGFTGKAGTMPPKGGGTYLDLEVARAVAYMANHAGASFAEPATLTKK